MLTLIQLPESDDPAERARIPQWLKKQTKERRRLFAWLGMIIPLFIIILPLITVLGVFFDAEGCSQLLGNSAPWACSTIPRGAVALTGVGLVTWTFMRWLIFVMRIYRYRDDRDLIDSDHPDRSV